MTLNMTTTLQLMFDMFDR